MVTLKSVLFPSTKFTLVLKIMLACCLSQAATYTKNKDFRFDPGLGYDKFVELNKELEVIQREERTFNTKETEPEPTEAKYDINHFFDYDTLHVFLEKG